MNDSNRGSIPLRATSAGIDISKAARIKFVIVLASIGVMSGIYAQTFPDFFEVGYLKNKKLLRIDYYAITGKEDTATATLNARLYIKRRNRRLSYVTYSNNDTIRAKDSFTYTFKQFISNNSISNLSVYQTQVIKDSGERIVHIYKLSHSDTAIQYDYKYDQTGRLIETSTCRGGQRTECFYQYTSEGLPLSTQFVGYDKEGIIVMRYRIIYRFVWRK